MKKIDYNKAKAIALDYAEKQGYDMAKVRKLSVEWGAEHLCYVYTKNIEYDSEGNILDIPGIPVIMVDKDYHVSTNPDGARYVIK